MNGIRRAVHRQQSVFGALALGLLVILTHFLLLGSLPPAVNYDEAIIALTSLELGRSRPFEPFVMVQNGWEAGWLIILSGAFQSLGHSTFVFRAASAVTSILGIMALAGATGVGLPRMSWLVSGLILTTAPWFLTMGRSGYRSTLLFLALGIAFLGIWWLVRSHQWHVAVIGGVATAAPLYVYTSGRVIVLLLLLYAGSLALTNLIPRRLIWGYYAGAALGLFPMLQWVVSSPENLPHFFFNIRGRGLWQDGVGWDDVPRYAGQIRADIVAMLWSQPRKSEGAPAGVALLPWWVTLGAVLAMAQTVNEIRFRRWRTVAIVGVLWVSSLGVIFADGLLPTGPSAFLLLAAGIPLAILSGWGLSVLPGQWKPILVIAAIAVWTAWRGYFSYGLEQRGFDAAYQVGFDRVTEALTSLKTRSGTDDVILIMNEAHEPAVRWNLLARDVSAYYALVDTNRLLQAASGSTLTQTLTSLRNAFGNDPRCGQPALPPERCQVSAALDPDALIFFASEAEAARVTNAFSGALQGEELGPYKLKQK